MGFRGLGFPERLQGFYKVSGGDALGLSVHFYCIVCIVFSGFCIV